MCTVLLPPGDNPIAVNKYIISIGEGYLDQPSDYQFVKKDCFIKSVIDDPYNKLLCTTKTVDCHARNRHNARRSHTRSDIRILSFKYNQPDATF